MAIHTVSQFRRSNVNPNKNLLFYSNFVSSSSFFLQDCAVTCASRRFRSKKKKKIFLLFSFSLSNFFKLQESKRKLLPDNPSAEVMGHVAASLRDSLLHTFTFISRNIYIHTYESFSIAEREWIEF